MSNFIYKLHILTIFKHVAGLYCLYGDYPGCDQRIPTSGKVDFCELHLQQAKQEG